MKNDALGDRMKSYEAAASQTLVPRMPILIRVDGRAFHTLTRGMEPFDSAITGAMNAVAQALMIEAQGAVLGYVQSDEFSIVLQTDARPETQPWFGGKVQKICSIAAAVATAEFNHALAGMWNKVGPIPTGMFDARCWNMPWEDVPNYFLWRWKDATRNSVSSYARTFFSHKTLHGKSVPEMKKMIEEIPLRPPTWDMLPSRDKQGNFIINDAALANAFSLNVFREIDYSMIDGVIRAVKGRLRGDHEVIPTG